MSPNRAEQLEQMLASGADSTLLRFSLGSEYLARAQYAPAIVHLAEAVTLDPRFTAAWKLYGKALAAAGETERAREAFGRGIDAAEAGGDLQAAREMRVFLKRLPSRPG